MSYRFIDSLYSRTRMELHCRMFAGDIINDTYIYLLLVMNNK